MKRRQIAFLMALSLLAGQAAPMALAEENEVLFSDDGDSSEWLLPDLEEAPVWDEEEPEEIVPWEEQTGEIPAVAEEEDGLTLMSVTEEEDPGLAEEDGEPDPSEWPEDRIPVCEYYFPDREPGENEMLVGDSRYIGKWLGYYLENAEHPYGEGGETKITEVTLGSQYRWEDDQAADENGEKWRELTPEELAEGNLVNISLNDNEDGWDIYGRDYGKVELILSYDRAEGDPCEEEGVYRMDLYINGDKFDFGWDYPDDSDMMLTNSEMTVTGTMSHRWQYGDDGGYQELEDFHLEIQTDEEGTPYYDTGALEASVTEDGKGILIASKERDGGYHIPVKVCADVSYPDGREEEIELYRNLYLFISGDYYYVIEPQRLTADGKRFNPAVGEVLDMNFFEPKVIRCEKNPESGEIERTPVSENVRFRLEYDPNVWLEAEGSQEDAESGALPVLRRKEQWDTGVDLIAEMNFAETDQDEADWQEIIRKSYWFNWLDYGAWFENEDGNLRGGDHTWVFEDEELNIPLNLTNAEACGGAFSVEWQTGSWDEGEDEEWNWTENESIPKTCYRVEADHSVTLIGEALKEYFEETGEQDRWFQLRALLWAGTDAAEENGSQSCRTLVWDGTVGVDLRTPQYELEDDQYYEFLVGEGMHYVNNEINCWAEDQYHPWGEHVVYTIENIRAQTIRFDEHGAVPDPDAESVMECRYLEDENIWTINAVGPGSAWIIYEVIDPERGMLTFTRDKHVMDRRYVVDIEKGSDCLLPGAETVWHPVVVELTQNKDGSVENRTLSGEEFLIDYWIEYPGEEEAAVVLNPDGLTEEEALAGDVHIRAKMAEEGEPRYGETGIKVEVRIPQDGNLEDATDWRVYEQMHPIWVEPRYYRMFADGQPVIIEPGEALHTDDTNVVVKRFDEADSEEDRDNGVVLNPSEYKLHFRGHPDSRIELKEDGSVLIVHDDTMTSESDPQEFWIDLEAEIETGEEEPYWTGMGFQLTVCRHDRVKEATCTETGEYVEECSKCHKVLDKGTIPALGHTMVTIIDQAATCGTAGSKHEECTVCGDKKPAVAINATGNHSYKTIIDQEATCGAAGSKHEECTVCGDKKQAVAINATGNHNYQTIIDKEATCGAAGSKHDECKVCHDKKAAVAIPATGHHTYGAYTVTKAPTALASGVQTRKCSVCGHADTAAVAKLPATMTVNASTISLKTGQKTTKLTVTGLAAGDSVNSWTSSNTKLVTVKGNANGTCTITAAKKLSSKKKKSETAVIRITLASGKTADVKVTVQTTAVKTTKVTLPAKKVTLERGKTLKLAPVLTPITTLEKVTFKSSNKKVASVSSKGVVKALKSGTAKITVKSGKKSATLTVTVPKLKTVSIKNVKPELTLKKGKSTTLKPKLNPAKSEEKITYQSSNKKVATVSAKGKIVAKKKGTAKITVKSGKVKVVCVVTVK